MALKVPVAAVHCGFGGGSTNTEDTSVLLGSNSRASSGIASASVTLGSGSTTNTEDTSILAGSNSSASSGIVSASVTLCGGGVAFAGPRGGGGGGWVWGGRLPAGGRGAGGCGCRPDALRGRSSILRQPRERIEHARAAPA